MAIYNGNTLIGNRSFDIGDIINFEYSETGKEIFLPSGTYEIQCWGAQGKIGAQSDGGKGAYTRGTIFLSNSQLLYIYVGVQSSQFNNNTTIVGNNGGGASDVRLIGGTWSTIESLRSRIMVAAGGGGGTQLDGSNVNKDDLNNGAFVGGALIAPDGSWLRGGKGGSQIAGGAGGNTSGVAGSFGVGGQGGNANCGCGGAGYYGGGGGGLGTSQDGMGGGGSSFISGHPGCDAIKDSTSTVHTGQPNHYSGLIFKNTEMIAGNNKMPDPMGDFNIIGKSGNGFIRITVLGLLNKNLYFVKLNNNIFYYKDKWIKLDKAQNELTFDDIINYGIGDNKYIGQEYITKLQEFQESGRIEYIIGTHSIDEISRLNIRPDDEKIILDRIYNFNKLDKNEG